jgi:hypothetical protein
MPTEPYVVLVGVRFSNNLLSVLTYGGAIADKIMASVGGKVLPKEYYEKFSVKNNEFRLLASDNSNAYLLTTGNIILHEAGSAPKDVFARAEYLIDETVQELGVPNINRMGIIYGYKYNTRALQDKAAARFIRENFLNIDIGDGTEQAAFHISNKASSEDGKVSGNPRDYYNTFILGANKRLFKEIDAEEGEGEPEADAENVFINVDVQRYFGDRRYDSTLFMEHRDHVEKYISKHFLGLMKSKGLE